MEANKINIKVKHLTDKNYDVEIEQSATILDLKNTLAQITGVPATDQKLIFRGIYRIFKITYSNRKNVEGF